MKIRLLLFCSQLSLSLHVTADSALKAWRTLCCWEVVVSNCHIEKYKLAQEDLYFHTINTSVSKSYVKDNLYVM